jgi:hypothetical protein
MGLEEKAEAIVDELLLFASCYGVDGQLVYSVAKLNAIDVAIKMIDNDLETMKILGAKEYMFKKKERVKDKLKAMKLQYTKK